MDPLTRVREFLLDNVGHMTYPGNPSYHHATHRWSVPILCRTERGATVIGDAELDHDGHLIFVPSREDMLERLGTQTASANHASA